MLVGIIGFGNMGRALGEALADHGWNVRVFDKVKSKIKKKRNITRCVTDREVIRKAPVIILALKPQDIPAFFDRHGIKAAFGEHSPLLISIAAGVTASFYQKCIGRVRLVRVMPNLAALKRKSVSFLCRGRYASESDISVAKRIFQCVGDVFCVSESSLDKVTAISGSGPGYVFYFMNCLYQSALSLGFSPRLAREMTLKTFEGACSLLAGDQGGDFKKWIRKVASKGGTTQAALDVFDQHKVMSLVRKATHRAARRARQLHIVK